jgi:hypothetical protein
LDYTSYFNSPESIDSIENKAYYFKRPNDFDDKVSEIKKKIAWLRVKT